MSRATNAVTDEQIDAVERALCTLGYETCDATLNGHEYAFLAVRHGALYESAAIAICDDGALVWVGEQSADDNGGMVAARRALGVAAHP